MRAPSVSKALAAATVAAGLLAFGFAGCGGSSKKIPKPKTGEDAPNSACSGSQGCKIWGWCKDDGGECVAAADQECKDSQACKLGGLCSLYYGRCVALNDGDCSDSEWCKKYGYCDAEDGVCKD